MSLGVLHGAMLLGLLGVTIPVIVHLLNRRWDPVVDWGAMQFLELGRRARRRFKLTEWLLMLSRMALLALVALALARPFWKPRDAEAGAESGGSSALHRDVVLVLDGSSSMDRRINGTTPRAEALRWARQFIAKLKAGDSVALLVAKDRVQPLVDPPSFDRARVEAALAAVPASGGSSDLAAALAEAFRILERTSQPGRDVVILSDGQRFAWRPGETARWGLMRDLHRRLPVAPRIWAVTFGSGMPPDGPNGSVGPLALSHSLIAPGMPITVTTSVANAGPGELTSTAQLFVDDSAVPGSAQVIGPIPAGGRTSVQFETAIQAPGSHLVAVRLVPSEDSLPGDDESARPVEVAASLPGLLVDGKPGAEPFQGETDFLRAALSPTGEDSPLVRATVVKADAFGRTTVAGQRVVVLANVGRLNSEQAAALESVLASGGGVLIVLGERTDPGVTNALLGSAGADCLPALLGDWKGDLSRHQAVAHPAPQSFSGAVMQPFGQGDDPPLARAGLFAYRVLTPSKGAAVLARLDTGDPWLVERPCRRGRVALLAGPLDAEGGTLPVNPDFVPWINELVLLLADSGSGTRMIKPGEPIVLNLDAPAEARDLLVKTPGGATSKAPINRSTSRTQIRYDGTDEPGVYRIALPEPTGGYAYVVAMSDERERDLAPLEPAEAAQLARGWPLKFDANPDRAAVNLRSSSQRDQHEIWRGLVLAALAGLCVEVCLTRQMARGRGVAP